MKDWPLLILCPSALRNNWKTEFEKWITDDLKDDCNINVVQKGSDDLNGFINIISYTMAAKDPMKSKIEEKKFKTILCDESHFLKDEKSKRSSELCPILQKSTHCILLSGTASPSRPIEIFSQLKALNVFKIKKSDYGERYCDKKDVRIA